MFRPALPLRNAAEGDESAFFQRSNGPLRTEFVFDMHGVSIRAMWKSFAGLLLTISLAAGAQTAKPNLYFAFDKNSFSSTGRWIPSDTKDKAANPAETEIDCDRLSRTCIEASAEYYGGHPHVSIDYFEITKWDADGIVARSSSGICMTRTLLISFADKSLSDTHAAKVMDKDKADACASFGASGTEIDVFVVKNSPKWQSNPYGSNE